jgi:methionyl-tRNA formyltransferase
MARVGARWALARCDHGAVACGPTAAIRVQSELVIPRSVFFGTPEFAVPALAALHEHTHVVGVVCQPDRRAGRGMKLMAPPVKEAALAHGLEVHQPVRVRDGGLARWLEDLRPDVALVVAYGRILPPSVLAVPARGCLNLHASVLPKYRGAAPIQWAIAEGETETGISLMQMDAGMDTGPVFAARRMPISPETTGGELTRALAALAAEMVPEEFLAATAGRLMAVPQDDARANAAPPITKEHLAIDWSRSSTRIVNQVRAFAPAPGAFTFSGQRRLKIREARAGAGGSSAAPGTILGTRGAALEVACGGGSVDVWRAGAEGKGPQSGRDLVNGRWLEVGGRLCPAPDEIP